MPENDQRPIIKKVIKVQAAGHHGGAWKVAYADFTTAMMAFFMLLWLLNVAPPETLAGLADYFSPTTAAVSGHTGAQAINPPKEDALGANPSSVQLISHPGPPKTGPTSGKDTGADAKDQYRVSLDDGKSRKDIIAARAKSLEDQTFKEIEEDLRLAIQASPLLQEHSDQLIFEITEDGLKIQIIDKDKRAMFKSGNAEFYEYARALISEVARGVVNMPNRISLLGHTDGGVFVGPNGTSNWELSSERANAARRVLDQTGVTDDRFSEVIGKASTDPLYPDQPNRIENRRITILILREAPVVPPDFN